MLWLVKEARDIEPAVELIDLVALIPEAYRHVGPLVACLTIWQVYGEVESAGRFSAEVRYVDIEGQMRTESAGTISLATPLPVSETDPALSEPMPRSTTGFFVMKRQSPASVLQLAMGVVSPGGAKVGYSFILGPAAPTDLIAI